MDMNDEQKDPFATLLTQSQTTDFRYVNNNEPITELSQTQQTHFDESASTSTSEADSNSESDEYSSNSEKLIVLTVPDKQHRARDEPESLLGDSPQRNVSDHYPDACAVCGAGAGKRPIRVVSGVSMCHPCRCFYDKRRNMHRGGYTFCISGTNSCEMTPTSRACGLCRYIKVMDLVAKAGQIKINTSYDYDGEEDTEVIPEKRSRLSVSRSSSREEYGEQLVTNQDRCIADVISNSRTSPVKISHCQVCEETAQPFVHVFNVTVCHPCRVFYQSWLKRLKTDKSKALPPCVEDESSIYHGRCRELDDCLRRCSSCRFDRYYTLAIEAGGHEPLTRRPARRSSDSRPNDLTCEICDSLDHVYIKRDPVIACCKTCDCWFRDRACRNNYALASTLTCPRLNNDACCISRAREDYDRYKSCRRCRFVRCLQLGMRVTDDPDLDALLDMGDYSLDEIISKKFKLALPANMNLPRKKKQKSDPPNNCKVCEEVPQTVGQLCGACNKFVWRNRSDNFVGAKNYICNKDEANVDQVLCSQRPSEIESRYERCKKCRLNKCITTSSILPGEVSWMRTEPAAVTSPCEICGDSENQTTSCRGRRVCWSCKRFTNTLKQNNYEKASTFTCDQENSDLRTCILKNSRHNRAQESCSFCRLQRVIGLGLLDDDELILLASRRQSSAPKESPTSTRHATVDKDTTPVSQTFEKCPICLEKNATNYTYGKALCVACATFLRRSAEDDFEKGESYSCGNPENDGQSIVCDLRPRSIQKNVPCQRCRLNKLIALGFVTLGLPRINSNSTSTSLMRIDTENSINDIERTLPEPRPRSGSPVSKLTASDVKMVYEVYKVYFSNEEPTRAEKMIISYEFKLKYKWVSFLFRKFKSNK